MLQKEKTTISPNYITLNSNHPMPLMGLGTFNTDNLPEIVYTAISSGIRLIDTASKYNNEEEVGKGIHKALSEGKCKRSDLFIITKLWCTEKHDPKAALKRSLSKLNLDYVDLYLVHNPMPDFDQKTSKPRHRTPMHLLWEGMEGLVDDKLAVSIGVSNFSAQVLLDISTYARIMPAVNEIELHPYFQQKELRKVCAFLGIRVIAFNSLLRNCKVYDLIDKRFDLFEEKLVKDLAGKYGKTVGQVLLCWAISQGVCVIPNTSNKERLKENYHALEFRLDEGDLSLLGSLDSGRRFFRTEKYNFSLGLDIFC